ncbi:MAG: gliding motility lipoprotein GldD [Bacteroidia bacterium]|nr:gliding motility lipoprotein GldD [Bacteroidia bacterium]
MFSLVACNNYVPKPSAYPRVEYPIKTYEQIDADCPFSFEIPKYSELQPYTYAVKPCWYNLNYTPFNATLHTSYVSFNNLNELDSLAEDSYKLAFKHISKADEIIEREISDSTKGLYGMIYDLQGKTATPFNFYLTDGKNHFFRGSFYFNEKTKLDSIQPIYEFINADMMHTIETFEFKQ